MIHRQKGCTLISPLPRGVGRSRKRTDNGGYMKLCQVWGQLKGFRLAILLDG